MTRELRVHVYICGIQLPSNYMSRLDDQAYSYLCKTSLASVSKAPDSRCEPALALNFFCMCNSTWYSVVLSMKSNAAWIWDASNPQLITDLKCHVSWQHVTHL